MAKRSSFFLAVLFIANPFMLLFYQNCSSAPKSYAYQEHISSNTKSSKSPASEMKSPISQRADARY